MIRPINKLIEYYLLAYLYKKQDAIVINAVKSFESEYPEATEMQRGILKTKLMYEKTRVSPIVDGHLKATIIRAQQTFWFTVLCNLMIGLVSIFFSRHIFTIFSPLINALIAWNSTALVTSAAAYEQRVIAAMESTIIIFVIETGLQKNPLNGLLIADAIVAPPPLKSLSGMLLIMEKLVKTKRLHLSVQGTILFFITLTSNLPMRKTICLLHPHKQ